MSFARNIKLVLATAALALSWLSPVYAGSKDTVKPHIKVTDATVLGDMRMLFNINDAKTCATTFLEALKPGTRAERKGELMTPAEYFALPLSRRPSIIHPHTLSLLVFAVDQALFSGESRPSGHCRAYVWVFAPASRFADDPFKQKPVYLMGTISGGPQDWKLSKGLVEHIQTLPGSESVINPATANLVGPRTTSLAPFIDGWEYAEAILLELQALRGK